MIIFRKSWSLSRSWEFLTVQGSDSKKCVCSGNWRAKDFSFSFFHRHRDVVWKVHNDLPVKLSYSLTFLYIKQTSEKRGICETAWTKTSGLQRRRLLQGLMSRATGCLLMYQGSGIQSLLAQSQPSASSASSASSALAVCCQIAVSWPSP